MKKIFIVFYLLSLFLPMSNCAAGNDPVIASRVAGISMSKPDGWKFVRVGEIVDQFKEPNFNPEEFRAAMATRRSGPVIAISKYSEPFGDINPSIKITVGPAGSMSGMKPLEAAKLVLPLYEQQFPNDFEVSLQPTPTIVAGFEAAYDKMSFSFKIQGAKKLFLTSELWIIVKGEYLFVIEAATEKNERTGSREEIHSIIETIRMAQ